MATIKWTDENTAALTKAVEGMGVVSQESVHAIASDMGTSPRSVGSKLRKLGFEVQKASEAGRSNWSEAEQEELVDFLNANSGAFTFAEIAATVVGGKFSTKQVQGKILSLELTDAVKPTEKAVAVRTYTEAEEAQIVELANGGASMEDVAEAMGRSMAKVRGKCLSLHKEGRINAIPKQAVSTAKAKDDILEGVDYASMTVAEIAEKVTRSERGIKALLTRRKIDCADYSGSDRAAKLASKKEA